MHVCEVTPQQFGVAFRWSSFSSGILRLRRGSSSLPSPTCSSRKKHKCRGGVFSKISTVAESEDSQESVDSVTDSQKRREILSRRPSYRQVLRLEKRHPRIQQWPPLLTNLVANVCLSHFTGRSSTIYRQTLPRCLESKKRSRRTTLPPPSLRLPCPLPSIRPAAASTVSVSLLGRRQRGARFRVLMLSCLGSRHHSGWGDPAGQQRHRRRAGSADADHGEHRSRPARRNHPAVRPDQ